ncbi:hypothetical protein [Streptomyces sp. NPDC051572]|uniref:hypothetical protein n=1 Tax=Streptomyces sp. NPDC051572 TaxID=3155802 RepID=UPI00344E0D60
MSMTSRTMSRTAATSACCPAMVPDVTKRVRAAASWTVSSGREAAAAEGRGGKDSAAVHVGLPDGGERLDGIEVQRHPHAFIFATR